MGYRFWNGRQGRTGPQPLQMMMGGKVTAFASPEAMLGQAMRTDLSRIPADMRRHAERARDRVSVLSGLVQGLQKQQAAQAQRKAAITDHLKDEVVFSAPMKEEIAAVRRLEKERLIVPLSLRAWVEEVGHVNLSGEHPALCFWASEGFPGVYADPLMIFLDQLVLAQSAIPEYRVKATFLFQFTQFVDWPRNAFSNQQTPLVIGILGEDPFGTFLDDTVRDEMANGHPIAVERYQRLENVKNCQVLFVSRSEANQDRMRSSSTAPRLSEFETNAYS